MPIPHVIALAILVVTAAAYDIRFRRIPNWLVLPAIPFGLLLNAFYPGCSLKDSAIGFGAAFGFYMLLYILHGMAAGDVKLAGAIGAIAGWTVFFWIFIFSGAVGLILSLIVMVVRGRIRKTLSNTAFIAWEILHFRAPHLRSEEFDVQSPHGLRLPYGAVLGLGTLGVLGLRLFHG